MASRRPKIPKGQNESACESTSIILSMRGSGAPAGAQVTHFVGNEFQQLICCFISGIGASSQGLTLLFPETGYGFMVGANSPPSPCRLLEALAVRPTAASPKVPDPPSLIDITVESLRKLPHRCCIPRRGTWEWVVPSKVVRHRRLHINFSNNKL